MIFSPETLENGRKIGYDEPKSGNQTDVYKRQKYTSDMKYWGDREEITWYANWKAQDESDAETPISPSVSVHFPKVSVYVQGQFTDVPAAQWFTQNLSLIHICNAAISAYRDFGRKQKHEVSLDYLMSETSFEPFATDNYFEQYVYEKPTVFVVQGKEVVVTSRRLADALANL